MTHLTLCLDPPGMGFLEYTTFDGMHSNLMPFSFNFFSISFTSSSETSSNASFSSSIELISLLAAASHSSQCSQTSFGEMILVCRISSESSMLSTALRSLPITAISSMAVSSSSSTIALISSSMILLILALTFHFSVSSSSCAFIDASNLLTVVFSLSLLRVERSSKIWVSRPTQTPCCTGSEVCFIKTLAILGASPSCHTQWPCSSTDGHR